MTLANPVGLASPCWKAQIYIRGASTIGFLHTSLLYIIAKNWGYRVCETNEDEYARPEEVDLETYLKDLFDSYYSEFLLNFETIDLIEALE